MEMIPFLYTVIIGHILVLVLLNVLVDSGKYVMQATPTLAFLA